MDSIDKKVAVIGFGTVGSGVAKILLEKADEISHKTGIQLRLGHIVDTDLDRERPVQIPEGLLHNDIKKVINDPDIEIAVELIGGTNIACDITKQLLAAGKHVVTANKALLAERGKEVLGAARENNRCIAFEASCCGGIPIINALRTGLSANSINAMYGIVNGTCNYILSEMSNEGKDYSTALKEAQEAGYAEADPTLDVNGADSAHKLAILAKLAFCKEVRYEDIQFSGIDNIELQDIKYGQEMGYTMKLLAISEQTDKGLWLEVAPSFISKHEPLADVVGSFSAISIFGDAVGHTSYYGRGAGMMPTASAVVADIIEVARGNSQCLFESAPGFGKQTEDIVLCPADEIVTRFYLRLNVIDKPGVFAQIGKILGDCNISISALLQHERKSPEEVPVVIMTHKSRKGDIVNAISQLEQLDTVKKTPVCIHVITPPADDLS